MESEESQEFDMERLLAALRPPTVPNEVFDADNADLYNITRWKKSFAVSVLSALSTEPNYHANGIRLDWLQRLVFAHSNGQRKPQASELNRALNVGLDRANVLRLEDPNEDLFCELISTSQGNYRIFPGQWEAAAPYTQTLLDAFESLPPAALKRDTLISVYSLLTLSDAVAARANVHRLTPSAGKPMGVVSVPNSEALKRLARRVHFTDLELERLGVDKNALVPFFLSPDQLSYIGSREAGEGPLEFHPLLPNPNGTIVACPSAISLATRAVMVAAAQRGGVDKLLLSNMLIEQQKYSEASGFWPVAPLEFPPPDEHFIRATVCQFAEGRFLHVVHVPVTFEQFPQAGFASVRELSGEANQAIREDVLRFWRFLNGRADHRESMTVLLLSGWGTPHKISPWIEHEQAPKGWRFLGLGFADAAVLGACENGRFRDVWRIVEQVSHVEAQGFTIRNMNGILNLFGHWRTTGGNLIPEHMSKIEPPCNVVIPTDLLLAPRLEAAKGRDNRALPLPDGTFKVVQRVDWSDPEDLQPIYGSPEDATRGRLLGAVVVSSKTWWIEAVGDTGEGRERVYRIWHAVLQWLAAVGSKILVSFPDAFQASASTAKIDVAVDAAPMRIDLSKVAKVDLTSTVTGSSEEGGAVASVQILPEWMEHLGRPENDAEVELAAAVLEQLSGASAQAVPRDRLRLAVRDAIGSKDWRWLHARQVYTPLDRVASGGLVGRFSEIPLSATSLVKCGSIWGFRDRAEGFEISGEEECRSFLTRYRNHILNELISTVRRFNRERLTIRAAEGYQAARAEQSQWRGTIRALRAIHGAAADASALKRQYAINAVQRATKSICEIAACEAPQTGGAEPGSADLEEMYALTLLLFGNGQLFASIRAGLAEPVLRVSPTGDLLSDRSVPERMLRPGAEWSNLRALNDAATAYGQSRTEKDAPDTDRLLPWGADLRKAVEAEYGASSEAFVDLQYVLVQVAEEKGEGVFAVRRSELKRLVNASSQLSSEEPAALLERLTLVRRPSWTDTPAGLTETDIDLSRLDRAHSLINRPLLAIDDQPDPHLVVAPVLVSDSAMYCLSGLMEGSLQNQFWVSQEARRYAGTQADRRGKEFEESVANRLRQLGLKAWSRCKLSWALNDKVDNELGNIDILAVSPDRQRVWVIEAKNLRLCRTEAEVAARLSEYRGRAVRDGKGREKPDKMLRHIRRTQYLRERSSALVRRLELDVRPEVRGLLIVDAPQPMNFHMLEQLKDGQSAFLDAIDRLDF